MDMQESADSQMPEMQKRLQGIMQQLRSVGFLGDTAGGVGVRREASPDPMGALTDGLAPMVRAVPQVDR